MLIRAFYDFYNDNVRPLQLIIRPEPRELDWTRTLFVPVSGPFEKMEVEDFGEFPSVSVLLGDLTQLTSTAAHIGINLAGIAARHGTDIEQLILQMDDVEEVLKYSY
ncbi:hypothetical protein M3650_14810 [Paenibacillus sp. MER TA 81-3]|uniref:hypothetical protein n=1 Tax=Paenibacillus sp. MER TA 81-3 TaxID=2939573 RepID=UPI00203BCBEF|nr:hypothetical protein [Paenibacillus sp. MER TA 81-3]MCM3339864.1 hypothetical protein [Paenibacillus sp. MER TA 81-3]